MPGWLGLLCENDTGCLEVPKRWNHFTLLKIRDHYVWLWTRGEPSTPLRGTAPRGQITVKSPGFLDGTPVARCPSVARRPIRPTTGYATATNVDVLLRVVCGPCRSRRGGGRASAGALADSIALPMSMAKITMRSSGEVQPPEAVLGAGIDLTKALLQRRCFRSKVSWHGERSWRPAASWLPQPRSARIHWIGAS